MTAPAGRQGGQRQQEVQAQYGATETAATRGAADLVAKERPRTGATASQVKRSMAHLSTWLAISR
jgi:Trp operon repressor